MFMDAMEGTVIQSRQNALLKRFRAVAAGKEEGRVVLEGRRLIEDAILSGVTLEVILAEQRSSVELEGMASHSAEVRLVGAGLLDGIGGLKTSPGLLALCQEPCFASLDSLQLDATTRLLAIDGVADPGNLGALARSAEALGVKALLVVRGGARPWSAKALRGSMGSLLRLPVASFPSVEALCEELERRDIEQVVARTRDGVDSAQFEWRGPLALWVPSETGATHPALERASGVTIAMQGKVESLNVTVAASLLLEAARRGVAR
jgi:tRNA G18 (ribose-2'-O)-methylase SpoU